MEDFVEGNVLLTTWQIVLSDEAAYTKLEFLTVLPIAVSLRTRGGHSQLLSNEYML